MFTAYPTYDRYRTLSLKSPQMRGEDVYALQTALNDLGFWVGETDGIYGGMTDRAVKECQRFCNLTVDGLVGGITQRELAMRIIRRVRVDTPVPTDALKGSLEHESGFRLGNYSPQRANGSYDAGVAQRNTDHTPPAQGFNVPMSITALAQNTLRHFKLFEGLPQRRRWALAQGAWNAPAFACYIAREEGATKVTSGMVLRPSDSARKTFEAYVSVVSKYLVM